jgi:hypothetical protein
VEFSYLLIEYKLLKKDIASWNKFSYRRPDIDKDIMKSVLDKQAQGRISPSTSALPSSNHSINAPYSSSA